MNAPVRHHRARNRRLATRLAIVVVAMFGFGYALVPLYEVICEITGFGGRTGVVQEAELEGVVDQDRTVTVEFLGTVNSALPWEFRPTVSSMRIHPGQVYETEYLARNLSAATLIGQARPAVNPTAAATFFSKTECFCFSEQRLEGGEQRAMPVRFVVARDLPPEIRTITLSYTFFNAEARS